MPSLTLPPRQVRIAWMIGELGYRLRNIQKQLRQDWIAAWGKGQKFYAECTRRFGKSAWLLFMLTEFCLKHPGARGGYYAPVKEGLRDYIVPIIAEVFKDCPDSLRPTLDSNLTLTFPNKSTIIFRGSNNQQHRLRRGVDLQIAAIDEARDVDDLDDLIDSVVFPALFKTGGRLLIASTPADTEDHPLHAIKQQAEKEGRMSHYSIYDAQKFDPEEFTAEKIALWRKETQDEVAWAREFEAKWVKDPTKIIIPEWNDSQVRLADRDERFGFYHKYAALDSGVTDKTAGLLGYYDFARAKLYIEDEFALQDAEVRTDKIADMFKKKEVALGYQTTHDRKTLEYSRLQPHEKVYRRVADNNNLILVNDLNSLYSLDFFPTRKDELVAMLNLTREWAKDDRIVVAPHCTELLGCLRNAVWDKKREKLAKSKVYGHFDALMALVYLIRNVDTVTNPVPKFFGKTSATHAIPPGSHLPETSGDRLAKMFRVKTDRDQARADFVRGGGNGIG